MNFGRQQIATLLTKLLKARTISQRDPLEGPVPGLAGGLLHPAGRWSVSVAARRRCSLLE
jgi:hypothetical protein